jgi:hypothetical protein
MLNKIQEKSQRQSDFNDENTAQFAQQSQHSTFKAQPDSRQLDLEKVAAIDLNNFPTLPQEIKNIILQKQHQYK